MSTGNKIAMWFGIIVGAGGLILGIIGAVYPKPLVDFFNRPDANVWVSYAVPGFIILTLVVVFLPFAGLAMGAIKNVGIKGRLRKTGVRTTATIVSIQDTGVTVNLSPLVRFTVETKEHFKGTFNAYVSRVDLPSVGDTIEVVYNPANTSEIMSASSLQ